MKNKMNLVNTEMIEKGLVYFLKTGVKIPYFVLLVGRLTLKNVTAVAEGVRKTALLKWNKNIKM